MKFYFNIFILVFSAHLPAQVSLSADTDKVLVSEGERFVLSIIQQIGGSELQQESPLRTADLSQFNIIASSTATSSFVVAESRAMIKQTIYEFLLEPKETGRLKIGSFLVSVSGKIYKTEPFIISVKNNNSRSVNTSKDFVYLSIESQAKEVLVNEPMLIVLKAYSRNFNNFRRLKNISFKKNENFQIKLVNQKRSEIEQNEDISSQKIAEYYITANKSGSVIIPSFKLDYIENNGQTNTIVTRPFRVNVRGLPSVYPKNYSGSVGEFNYTLEAIKNKTAVLNSAFTINLKIEGNGTVDVSKLPKLENSKFYTVYKPRIQTSIKNSPKGLQTSILAKYVIIPKKIGSVEINVNSFNYFDPKQEKFIDISPQKLLISVLPETVDATSPSEFANNTAITHNVFEEIPLLNKNSNKALGKNIYTKIAVSSAFILLGALAFLLVRRKKNEYNTASSKLNVEEKKHEVSSNFITFENDFIEMENYLYMGHYGDFYIKYQQVISDIETELNSKKTCDLFNYLEIRGGRSVAEKYKFAHQAIQMEKYSPVKTMENILQHLQILKTQLKYLDISENS